MQCWNLNLGSCTCKHVLNHQASFLSFIPIWIWLMFFLLWFDNCRGGMFSNTWGLCLTLCSGTALGCGGECVLGAEPGVATCKYYDSAIFLNLISIWWRISQAVLRCPTCHWPTGTRVQSKGFWMWCCLGPEVLWIPRPARCCVGTSRVRPSGA